MARIDPRNHVSVVDNTKVEWLGDLKPQERILLNSLMHEADEFADQELMEFCYRHMKLGTSEGGARAELMARIAMHDEARRDAQETRTPPTNPELPRGP